MEGAQALARLVSDAMGGKLPYDAYEHLDLRRDLLAAKAEANSDVLLIGALPSGGARPRALLFKALADRVGLPCELRASDYTKGAHAGHAWVVLSLDDVPGLEPPERPVGAEEDEDEDEDEPAPPAAAAPAAAGEDDDDDDDVAPPPALPPAAAPEAAAPEAAPAAAPEAAAAPAWPVPDRVIVDLMHAPGELLREGTEGALRYQRLGRHAFRALPSTARGWSTLLPKPKR